MMKLRLAIAFLSVSHFLFSQSDTTKHDSIPQHSVKKAVIFSAVLPGAGQFYNYANTAKGVKGRNNVFWKVPIFYAAVGSTGYFLIKNQVTQQSLKNEYKDRLNNVPTGQLNPKWTDYDNAGVLTLYKRYSTRRDLSILAFGMAYLFQVIDAGVGAHFVKFDVSDDLTFQIHPVLLNTRTAGIGLSLNFR